MSIPILENAIVRMLKRRPFYGQFLLGLRRIETGEDHPLGVTVRDGVPTLSVNPLRFGASPPAVQEGLLEHCIKHLLHLHMLRRKGRTSRDWDLACDLAINPTISHLPAGAALPAAFALEEGLAAEEYYALLADPFDLGRIEGHGSGAASRDRGGGRGAGDDAPLPDTVDDHLLWEDADSTPLRLAEEVVRGMVREAWRQADGEVPADIREVVAGMLAPSPIPWRQVLRQFVAAAGRTGRRSTWLKEHRRFAHGTPGIRKRRRLNLLVGIDVSDSTDIAALREAFAAELVRISRGREAAITVLYANSRIQRVESFRGSAAVAEVYLGGGFTDLRPVFAYARTMHPLPAAVIYLTDGAGPAPEKMEFPTLWVLTREGEKPAPWGVEMRLEV
ncbi:VWA-like domain-containing protein [Geobacter sp.]|uniref:vWA domain-containing protein n=1 Tax=Geobacter sp. TaxID=46610 RepID=UPI00262921ED|nr:VWA-like domain-containing protein [Geobacter sp.]